MKLSDPAAAANGDAGVGARDANRPLASRRWAGGAVAVGLLSVGVAIDFWPTLRSGFARMQSDPGDTIFNAYVLEHGLRALIWRSGSAGFWSPPYFYPATNVLAYSDNLLGGLPVYAVLRAFWAPFTAFQVWTVLMVVLTYAATWWAMRALRVGSVVSALAAFVFAFGLPRSAQLAHQQLLPQFFTPLAVVAAWRFTGEPSVRHLAWVLVWIVAQLLAGIYLGWFLVLASILFVVVCLTIDRGRRRGVLEFVRARWVAVLAVTGAAAGLTVVLLAPYLGAARDLGPREWTMVADFVPRFRSWLAPPRWSWWNRLLGGLVEAMPVNWEHRLFPGGVVIVGGLVAVIRLPRLLRDAGPRRELPDRGLLVAAALATATILMGLASGTTLGGMLPAPEHAAGVALWTPWQWIYAFVPGAQAIRAVGRIALTSHLFLILAVAVATDEILRSLSVVRARWMAVGLVLATVADQVVIDPPSFAKHATVQRIGAIAEQVRPECTAFYARLDPAQPAFVSQLEAMWASLLIGVPTVNGYSGSSPPGYPDPSRTISDEEVWNWLGETHRGGVCVIPARGAS